MSSNDEREALQQIINLQSAAGNWNYDHYMHGLLNGLIIAQSIIDHTQNASPVDPPDQFLCDIKEKEKQDQLHNDNPCLKQAWDHYQLILKLTQQPPKNTP